MKIFTIILSLYFLGLNFGPCEDTFVDKTEIQTEFSQAADHDHNHATGDICSPFCNCHCCHVHTINFGVTVFEPLHPMAGQISIVHFDSLGNDFQNSILQPPRA